MMKDTTTDINALPTAEVTVSDVPTTTCVDSTIKSVADTRIIEIRESILREVVDYSKSL